MLEVTKKDTMLTRLAARYIWKNDLATKYLDPKNARSRANNQRTLCEKKKLDAIYGTAQ